MSRKYNLKGLNVIVCLPAFLKKGRRTHYQFLNHVFWNSRENIEKEPRSDKTIIHPR